MSSHELDQPSAEAVEDGARAEYEALRNPRHHGPWELLPSEDRRERCDAARVVLTGAWPRLRAQITRHHADLLDALLCDENDVAAREALTTARNLMLKSLSERMSP